jgi:hypothetical protein
MINIWGQSERSTYHTTCVRRVDHYLKKKCSGVAHSERKLVAERITDASGYDKKRKTWYLCEIKVNFTDFQKALYQIHDTAYRFPKNPFYHKGDAVVPVIALPSRLAKELVVHNIWDSLRDICRKMGVAIWVIEQSTIREVMGPNVKKAVKTKNARVSTAKKKTIRVKKAASKTMASKTSKVRPFKATKKKTNLTKSTKPRKSVVKTLKSKKPKTQSTKRKTSRTSKSITKRKR